MGLVKVQRLVEPDSSVIEAVGYTVFPDVFVSAEAIYVETNFGKIYEYLAHEGDSKDYLAEFNKIAHGDSAGRAWHAFKKDNHPYTVMDAGEGLTWGEYQLVLDEPAEGASDNYDDTDVKEDPVNHEVQGVLVHPVSRYEAFAGALALAQISGQGNVNEVLKNTDTILEYLNK